MLIYFPFNPEDISECTEKMLSPFYILLCALQTPVL